MDGVWHVLAVPGWEAIYHRPLILTDLRGSTLGGWHLKRQEFAGIIVNAGQMRELAMEIGIQVIE